MIQENFIFKCEYSKKSHLYKHKLETDVTKMNVKILGRQETVKQFMALKAIMTQNKEPAQNVKKQGPIRH